MNNLLIIMQGLPGSGKSTLAKNLKNLVYCGLHCEIFSTDELHMEGDKYVFKVDKVKEYHKLNQEKAREFMKNNPRYAVCIIDNTNITCFQAKPYVLLGVEFGWDIQFIRCTSNWKNIHGVPQDTLDRMRESMENLEVEKCLNS